MNSKENFNNKVQVVLDNRCQDVKYFDKHNGLLTVHLNTRSTWQTTDMLDELIDINGYKIVRNDRKWAYSPKKGGGVCAYIKYGLNFKLNVMPELYISFRDLECQNFEITFKNENNLVVINLYGPPQGNVETFVNLLDTAL